MKKVFIASAGVAAWISGTMYEAGETTAQDAFAEVAHIPPADCIARAGGVANLAITAADIEYDRSLALMNNNNGYESVDAANEARDVPIDYSEFPHIDIFLKDKEVHISNPVLPRLQLEQEMTRYNNDWRYSAENHDYVIERTLQTVFPDERLRNLAYACIYEEIYSLQRMAGSGVEVALVGKGEFCTYRERITPSDVACSVVGSFSPNDQRIIVTRRNPNLASSTMAHEYGHLIQDYLGIKPEERTYREHFADSFEAVAIQIMQEEDRWIFTEPEEAGLDAWLFTTRM